MKIDPKEIKGNWAHGWALDTHTLSSVPMGPNEWGHLEFKTIRSEIGEAVYKLKYKNDRSQVGAIAQITADFIKSKQELKDICAIIPTPPSDASRPFQPVVEISKAVGIKLGISAPLDYLQKIKQTPILKNMNDNQKRRVELQGAFKAADERYMGRHVLIFDDLFRSGETLKEICSTLNSQGRVGKMSVVTATATRSKR